jgi:hypothetical protein
LKIAAAIAYGTAGRAWIPAPSARLRTGSAGMTGSDNRQSINSIGRKYQVLVCVCDDILWQPPVIASPPQADVAIPKLSMQEIASSFRSIAMTWRQIKPFFCRRGWPCGVLFLYFCQGETLLGGAGCRKQSRAVGVFRGGE